MSNAEQLNTLHCRANPPPVGSTRNYFFFTATFAWQMSQTSSQISNWNHAGYLLFISCGPTHMYTITRICIDAYVYIYPLYVYVYHKYVHICVYGMAKWVESTPSVLGDQGIWRSRVRVWSTWIWTRVESNQWLSNWYLPLPSQALSIIRIGQGLVGSVSG